MKNISCFSRLIATLMLPTVLLVQTSIAAIPLNPQDPGPSDAERYAQMVQMFEFWRELDRRLDRTHFDPVALGRQLETPQAAFEWVRDQTRPVPYKGVLRGARGVLQDRQGNSLDRALLLAEMIEAQGYPTTMIRGNLDGISERQALQDAWVMPFDPWQHHDDEALIRAAEGGAETLGLSPPNNPEIDSLIDSSVRSDAQWQEKEGLIIEALMKRYAEIDSDIAHSQAPLSEDWHDHWWVEAEVDGKILGLDPVLGIASSEQIPVVGVSRYSPQSLPEALFHSVEVRVIATVGNIAANESVDLVTAVVPVALVEEPLIQIGFVPRTGDLLDVFEEAYQEPDLALGLRNSVLSKQEWIPMIRVADELFFEKAIGIDGRIIDDLDAPPTARAIEDATGLLGNISVRRGLGGRSQPETSWLALSIEVTRQNPSGEKLIDHRSVFDLTVEYGVRWKEKYMGVARENQMLAALLSEFSVFLQSFHPSPYFFLDRQIDRILAAEDVFLEYQKKSSGGLATDLLEAAPSMPEALTSFLALRAADLELRSGTSFAEVSLIGHQAKVLPGQNHDIVASEIIDVFRSPIRQRLPNEPVHLHVRDSLNEWRIFSARTSAWSGAGDFYHDVSSDKADWLLLKSPSDWSRLPGARQSRPPAVFEEAWNQSRWVIAQPESAASSYPVGQHWWDMDPTTGDALIRDLLGRGAAGTQFNTICLALMSQKSEYAALITLSAVRGVLAGIINFATCAFAGGNGWCCLARSVGVGVGSAMIGHGLGMKFGEAISFIAMIHVDLVITLIPKKC